MIAPETERRIREGCQAIVVIKLHPAAVHGMMRGALQPGAGVMRNRVHGMGIHLDVLHILHCLDVVGDANRHMLHFSQRERIGRSEKPRPVIESKECVLYAAGDNGYGGKQPQDLLCWKHGSSHSIIFTLIRLFIYRAGK